MPTEQTSKTLPGEQSGLTTGLIVTARAQATKVLNDDPDPYDVHRLAEAILALCDQLDSLLSKGQP